MGIVGSTAGCAKVRNPVIVGRQYVLSANRLATSDEEGMIAINDARNEKDFQNTCRRLQKSDSLAVLSAKTVVRVLAVDGAKARNLVFVEVVYEGDTDVVMYRGHRFWMNALDLPNSY